MMPGGSVRSQGLTPIAPAGRVGSVGIFKPEIEKSADWGALKDVENSIVEAAKRAVEQEKRQ
jgi:hypothetical protein